jgi:hypothetical protein
MRADSWRRATSFTGEMLKFVGLEYGLWDEKQCSQPGFAEMIFANGTTLKP